MQLDEGGVVHLVPPRELDAFPDDIAGHELAQVERDPALLPPLVVVDIHPGVHLDPEPPCGHHLLGAVREGDLDVVLVERLEADVHVPALVLLHVAVGREQVVPLHAERPGMPVALELLVEPVLVLGEEFRDGLQQAIHVPDALVLDVEGGRRGLVELIRHELLYLLHVLFFPLCDLGLVHSAGFPRGKAFKYFSERLLGNRSAIKPFQQEKTRKNRGGNNLSALDGMPMPSTHPCIDWRQARMESKERVFRPLPARPRPSRCSWLSARRGLSCLLP